MRKVLLLVVSVALASAAGLAQGRAPLTLIGHYELTGAPAGHFDHVAVDLGGHRLFAADEGGAVEVVSLTTGKLIHSITAVQEPHAVLYRGDVNRLYVTDGGAGLLRIFDGTTYKQTGSVKLWDDADSVGYNPRSHMLHVDSGGGDLHQTFSHFSTVNTTSGKLVNDMQVDGDTIEAMALAADGVIYLNVRSKNEIAVIDSHQHKVTATWPVQGATTNVAMALDAAHQRLFVGCRSGQMVVFDTATGKQLQALPLGKTVDDMVYDAASGRIYAATDGAVDVFREVTPDKYEMTAVPSGPLGKTALLVPALHRYYVAVPKAGKTEAEILVFRVN